DALSQYPWPGNIRELRNIIEHCFIMESSDMIHLSSLPSIVLKGQPQTHQIEDDENDESVIDLKEIQKSVLDEDKSRATDGSTFSFGTKFDDGKLDFAIAKDQFEREFIIQALVVNKGRINQTALNANIPKKTL